MTPFARLVETGDDVGGRHDAAGSRRRHFVGAQRPCVDPCSHDDAAEHPTGDRRGAVAQSEQHLRLVVEGRQRDAIHLAVGRSVAVGADGAVGGIGNSDVDEPARRVGLRLAAERPCAAIVVAAGHPAVRLLSRRRRWRRTHLRRAIARSEQPPPRWSRRSSLIHASNVFAPTARPSGATA